MYEGKPPVVGPAPANPASAKAEEELHPVSWSELVARLAAARELRAALVAGAEAAPASFDAFSARRRAMIHSAAEQEANGNNPVNLENSANGKGAHATNRVDNRQQRPAPRGTP